MLFGPTLISLLAIATAAAALSADEYHPAAHPALTRRKLSPEQQREAAVSRSHSISKAAASRSRSRASVTKSKAAVSASRSLSRSKAAASRTKSALSKSKAISKSKSAASASKSASRASKASSTKTSAAASATSSAASTCYKFSALDVTMHDAYKSGTVALCSKFCGANYPFIGLLEADSPPAECLCVNAKNAAALGKPVKASLCNASFGSTDGDYVTVVPRKA